MNPEIHYNHETFRRLWNASDKVVYAIARQTLDMVGSSKATAYKSGETERSMYSRGVQKDSQGYYIGNFTNYASKVYTMGENTHWTNPHTRPQWFDSIWKQYGLMITNNCLRRYL